MEFKGTKGKWIKSLSKKNNIVVKSEDGFKVNLTFGKISGEDCTVPTCCKTEQHANALLVSKAPEMLYLLNDLLHDKGLNEVSVREIELLIKEATEL